MKLSILQIVNFYLNIHLQALHLSVGTLSPTATMRLRGGFIEKLLQAGKSTL